MTQGFNYVSLSWILSTKLFSISTQYHELKNLLSLLESLCFYFIYLSVRRGWSHINMWSQESIESNNSLIKFR